MSAGHAVSWLKNKMNITRLLKPHGIELIAVGGCHVSQEPRDEVPGYNSISVDAINRKYDNDSFKITLPLSVDDYKGQAESELT